MPDRLSIVGAGFSGGSFIWILYTLFPLVSSDFELGSLIAIAFLAAYLATAMLLWFETRIGLRLAVGVSLVSLPFWTLVTIAGPTGLFVPLLVLQGLLLATTLVRYAIVRREKRHVGKSPLDLPVFG